MTGRTTLAARRRPPARATHTAVVVDAMRRLIRGLRLAARRTQVETGLSAAQLFVLAQLADRPAASLGELAERTLTDRSSVAAVVERLAARGFVLAERDPGDRRRTAIAITSAGRALVRRAPAAPTVLLVEALGAMSGGDVRALARTLERLVEVMGLAGEPAPMLFEDEAPAAGTARVRARRRPAARERAPRRRGSEA
ncbi:MAG TPA: MarR family transcriptional regulator [Gemmatimonadaceae bacterium]|nr:MarR family transcriptional regulator [Gemmatimonadaceae bacterium]